MKEKCLFQFLQTSFFILMFVSNEKKRKTREVSGKTLKIIEDI